MKRHGSYEICGMTRDDAAGEAFDKVAKILNLGYPGGPEISKEAERINSRINALKKRYSDISLPRPLRDSRDFSFSFSGLKTAVLYLVRDLERKGKMNHQMRSFICAEFQQAVIDVAIAKVKRALHHYPVRTLVLGGGVCANRELRRQMSETLSIYFPRVACRLPSREACTDNAAMIAMAGYMRLKKGDRANWKKVLVDPTWKVDEPLRPLV